MQKKNILLMDYFPESKKEIKELLLKEGYGVYAVDSIKMAFLMIKEFEIDLIIYDLSYEKFIKRFHELRIIKHNPLFSQTPFLILVSNIEIVEYLSNNNESYDDFTTKPINSTLLLTRIKSIFSKREKINQTYARKLDNLKENISSALPHEIRTSLNGMLGYSKFIKELIRDKNVLYKKDIIDITEMLDSIYDSGKTLSRLTDNFLLYSQIQTLKLFPDKINELRQETCSNPEEILQEIIDDLGKKHLRIKDFNISILNESIRISCEYFYKIVYEIIDNALKFSKPESEIIIKAKSVGNTYNITIIDNGIGMTNEQIQSIDAYEQYSRDIQEQQGTGLGLMISKILTQLHKGKFEISSEENKGTKVLVKLPIKLE